MTEQAIVGLMLTFVLLVTYFLPTAVAIRRGHHNQNSIAIVNFFFGWTLIGWVISLAWAASNRRAS